MAEIKPRTRKRGADKAPDALALWEEVHNNPTPETFKLGRDPILQLAKIERDLFTDLWEKESGNYIVSGLTRKVTGMDFDAFQFGAGQILYNQSYQSGNIDTNSGLTQIIAPRLLEQTGHTYYGGEIITTLKDLCRYAYGEEEPNKVQRKAMETLIETLHNTPVVIKFPNGDEIEAYLCVTMFKRKRKKDKAIFYHLILNPIFCENVKRNFAEFPQNIMKRVTKCVKKKTEAHYKLLKLLGMQDKRKPFVRNIDTLLEDIGLMEAYRDKAGRTEEQLLSLFKDMEKIGIITKNGYKVERITSRRKKRISKVTFYLNPDFVKRNESDEEETATGAGAES